MRSVRCFICGTKRENRSDFGFLHRNGVRIPLCHPRDPDGLTCYVMWSGAISILGTRYLGPWDNS